MITPSPITFLVGRAWTRPTTITTAMLLGALLICSAPVSRAQNLLTNGSFELPVLSLEPFVPTLHPGTTNLPGWSVGGLGSLYLVLQTPTGLPALDGSQYIDFNGRPSGVTLSQSFPTTVGEMYEATFTLGRFQNPSTERVVAEAMDSAGAILGAIEAVAPLDVGWGEAARFRFTATSPTSTLQFRTTDGTVNIDLRMDAVSVERVTPRLTIETSHVQICWESEAGRTYQLQYRSTLTTNAWIDLGPPIEGIGALDCTIQPVNDPRRFYRIVRSP